MSDQLEKVAKAIWDVFIASSSCHPDLKKISFDDLKSLNGSERVKALRETLFAEAQAAIDAAKGYDLVSHLHRQRKFSEKTFGPGARVDGLIDHITRELEEVRENPTDVYEWIDVVLLAFDGAWRAGFSPKEIAAALEVKQAKNEGRDWPDWRTAPKGKAIEHKKSPPAQGGWEPMETAPTDGTPIQAEIPGNGSDNVIAWENFEVSGYWFFVTEQEPPDCWHDGICWDKNEDGKPSVKPARWKPLAEQERAG